MVLRGIRLLSTVPVRRWRFNKCCENMNSFSIEFPIFEEDNVSGIVLEVEEQLISDDAISSVSPTITVDGVPVRNSILITQILILILCVFSG